VVANRRSGWPCWRSGSIPSAKPGYAGVGPNFLPWLVSGALFLCGGFMLYGKRAPAASADGRRPAGDQALLARLRLGVGRPAGQCGLITTIGFILSCTLCFVLAVRGCAAEGQATDGRRTWVQDGVTGLLIAAPVYWMFTKVPGHQPARPDTNRVVVMDIWSQLIQGFATAGTPVNLLWALSAVPWARPSACCRASARPWRWPCCCRSRPRWITASMIFFAGIYYGAMYGGSTTSILLNTPGETASMVTAMEGNKMAKSGRAGAALATAAIGSFVAGTIATWW
jgi:hypothetical protein